jgi:hypothetical protein
MGTISKINAVSHSSIAKLDGLATTSIAKLNGQDYPSDDVILTNLIQHWDFADASCYSGSGTSFTDLAASQAGTVVNGPTYTSTAPKHFTFDGVNDYAECDIATDYGQDQTLEVWVKFPDFSDIKRLLFVRGYQSNCSTVNGGYWMQLNTSKQLQYTVGNVAAYSSTAQTLMTNTWYCFATTLNGSALRFFRNGSLISNTTASTTRYPVCATNPHVRTNTVPTNTGAINTSTSTNGSGAELRIYTSTLTDQQVTDNYDARKERYGYGDILETDLVIHLDAGDPNSYSGTGTTWSNLVSGTSFDFTLVNGPVYNADEYGYFQFDGANDYATKNSVFNFADYPSFSVEAWVYPDNSSSDHSICGQWQSTTAGFGPCILYLDVGDSAVGYDWIVRLTTGSTARIGTTTANGNMTEWNHVVATFSSTQIQLYVNNSLIGSASTGAGIVDGTNEGIAIGADRDSGGRYWDGKISQFRIYEKVLTSDEVTSNYNARKARYGL